MSGNAERSGAAGSLGGETPPRRIVSLSASNTEILCGLGLTRSLVGVDDWSDYPPAVKRLPRVGRDLDIDVERVQALNPDLVVACLSVPGMENNLKRLGEAQLKFIALKPIGLDTVLENIRLAGEATGRRKQAERLVTGMEARLAHVQAVTARAAQRPSVYWEWYPKPLFAAAGKSWMTRIIEMAGGRNVFADVDAESAKVEIGDVLGKQPEVIVACWCGARTLPRPERVARRPGWEACGAVQEGRVHVVSEALFGRPGPRLAEGLETLAAILHPELAAELRS